MSRSLVELDFFGMEKENSSSSSPSSSKSQFQKFLQQRQGMQSAISKLNPELLRTVINSGVASTSSNSSGSHFEPKSSSIFLSINSDEAAKGSENLFSFVPPAMPKQMQCTSSAEAAGTLETAPLTIFYNGRVSVFDVPRDKAEFLMKLAEKNGIISSSSSKVITTTTVDHSTLCSPSTTIDGQQYILDTLNEDLPIARRRSLQRFLEKRKERLSFLSSPYAYTPSPSKFEGNGNGVGSDGGSTSKA